MTKLFTQLIVFIIVISNLNAQTKKIAYINGGSNNALDTKILPALKSTSDFEVTEVSSKSQPADYNAYDLIIASENVSGSGDIPNLKGINKPFIMMKIISYNTSSNRWYWLSSSAGDYGTDVTGITNIVVSNKNHPIFAGVTFTGTNNDEIKILTTASASGGLSWALPGNITVTGGTIANLASIKGNPTHINIFEIPVGTTVTDQQGSSVTINNRWMQIGISSWSYDQITDDGVKLIKNACYYIMDKGTNKSEIKLNKIIASPNPSSDFITISSSINYKKLEILSIDGKILKTIKLESKVNTIEINDLKKGVYILKFDNMFTEKLIKK